MIGATDGIRIYCDPMIPKTRIAHRQERKWVRRLGFEKSRRYDFREVVVMIFIGGSIHVHPDNFQTIKNSMASVR